LSNNLYFSLFFLMDNFLNLKVLFINIKFPKKKEADYLVNFKELKKIEGSFVKEKNVFLEKVKAIKNDKVKHLNEAKAELAKALSDWPKKDVDARFDPYSKYEFSELPPAGSATPDVDLPYVDMPPAHLIGVAPQNGKSKVSALVFFGANPIAPERETIAPYAPGQAPIVMAARVSGDPDIKQSALGAPELGDEGGRVRF